MQEYNSITKDDSRYCVIAKVGNITTYVNGGMKFEKAQKLVNTYIFDDVKYQQILKDENHELVKQSSKIKNKNSSEYHKLRQQIVDNKYYKLYDLKIYNENELDKIDFTYDEKTGDKIYKTDELHSGEKIYLTKRMTLLHEDVHQLERDYTLGNISKKLDMEEMYKRLMVDNYKFSEVA